MLTFPACSLRKSRTSMPSEAICHCGTNPERLRRQGCRQRKNSNSEVPSCALPYQFLNLLGGGGTELMGCSYSSISLGTIARSTSSLERKSNVIFARAPWQTIDTMGFLVIVTVWSGSCVPLLKCSEYLRNMCAFGRPYSLSSDISMNCSVLLVA